MTLGSVTEEGLPAARAERQRRLLVLRPLFLHQRHEFAGDEGEGDEDRREHDARHREDDLDVMALEIVPEIALRAEQQHIDQARDDRRHREGQVDQRVQDALALELELGDGPGGRETEDDIGGNGDGGDEQRQPDGGERVGVGEGGEIGAEACPERLDEDRHQGSRRNSTRKTTAVAISMTRTAYRSVVTAGPVGARSGVERGRHQSCRTSALQA